MRQRISVRLLATAGSAALIWAALLIPPSTASATTTVAGSCRTVTLPVALSPGGPVDQTLSGILCRPSAAPSTTQVDVLVHGASYNRQYWDWPVSPGTYSYVAQTLSAGRATFALDRLGAGQSSHPLSALITTAADAYTLHQAVALMRSSGFSTVDVVGHSFGSVIAIDEAGTYRDVDKLVVTGLLHSQGTGLATVAATFYPADLDPQFGLLFPAGYLTTLPGDRGLDFYDAATADPTVIAYDEAHKDAISATELAAGITETELPALTNPSRLVTAPVLVVEGQQDTIFCNLLVNCADPAAVLAEEAPFYPAAARLAADTVPGTGHDIALHPSAAQSFAAIDRWIRTG
jgi:pimeloyl-ACP methyl ester carboxylesterase